MKVKSDPFGNCNSERISKKSKRSKVKKDKKKKDKKKKDKKSKEVKEDKSASNESLPSTNKQVVTTSRGGQLKAQLFRKCIDVFIPHNVGFYF